MRYTKEMADQIVANWEGLSEVGKPPPRILLREMIAAAIKAVIAETGAASVKDMGKVMAVMKDRFAGQMDFAKASGAVKGLLAG